MRAARGRGSQRNAGARKERERQKTQRHRAGRSNYSRLVIVTLAPRTMRPLPIHRGSGTAREPDMSSAQFSCPVGASPLLMQRCRTRCWREFVEASEFRVCDARNIACPARFGAQRTHLSGSAQRDPGGEIQPSASPLLLLRNAAPGSALLKYCDSPEDSLRALHRTHTAHRGARERRVREWIVTGALRNPE